MNYLGAPVAVDGLPAGLRARGPNERDVSGVVALLAARRQPGDKPVDVDGTSANLIGLGSWTRRQVIVEDEDSTLLGWAVVHDRAAGRTNVEFVVADVDLADRIASALLTWIDAIGSMIASQRGVGRTQLDATPSATDARQQGWLTAAGYEPVRRWLQMIRPVASSDGEPNGLPAPRAGVRVRRVREHASGLPVAEDVQTVHQVLEESFADHFNSYRESFAEFVERLREDPWHRWDHWWIAEIEVDGEFQPGGVVISSVSPADVDGHYGSYVDYIGVHRRARGRGVAKALLYTVIDDAAKRDRHWVGLEVDADSPTGADGLYRALGWEVDHVTQSWHRYIDAEPA
ncbi:MAG: GNAT family N-acetyltransferase [Propionibacteriaceae bacterium]